MLAAAGVPLSSQREDNATDREIVGFVAATSVELARGKTRIPKGSIAARILCTNRIGC